ncbi:STAS domain-containing protein [Synechococcus sp. RSCCF101]|uniref:sugar transferase n=1 Tax=Synechococcus sp. RSCCF101 TaxID=2511069 RepID=UPI001244F9A2|nr:sugar transferase [Synechococcus sp. RSCCF101]QEY31480.1 STAS domain-containing protein [Synechococcus sp. RSCCF101]
MSLIPDHPYLVSEAGGSLIITVPQLLTVNEADAFRSFLEERLNGAEGLKRLILDCAQTRMIDSSGVGSLVMLLRRCNQAGLAMELWSVNDQLKLALSLAGLDQMLTLVDGSDAITQSTLDAVPERGSLTHPSVRCWPKRVIDVVGSGIGLVITALLFIPIAIAIRSEGKGPILFSQTRCGLMGRRFRLWKFRSMVTDAEALKHTVTNQASGAIFKNENDPRITRVGRFLRRTSLDELPQFWNVFIGDMSLIGTRPPTPDEVEIYNVPEWRRFDVRPGLSGEWQVYGRSKVTSFEDIIELDLRYQRRWSFSYDLRLIVRTFRVLLSKQSGAM